MNNRMNKTIQKVKQQWGFTLVELLVVISIMSILTVITVSQFTTAQKKARDAQRKADTSAVAKALEMYYTDYGVFPEADQGRIKANGYVIEWGGEFSADNFVYMKVLPSESAAALPYCYEPSADLKMMGVYSNLENENDGDYNKLHNGTEYTCNGVGGYHFAILSPNADYAALH